MHPAIEMKINNKSRGLLSYSTTYICRATPGYKEILQELDINIIKLPFNIHLQHRYIYSFIVHVTGTGYWLVSSIV